MKKISVISIALIASLFAAVSCCEKPASPAERWSEERAAAWERLEVLRRETAGALPAWKRWVLVLLRPAL